MHLPLLYPLLLAAALLAYIPGFGHDPYRLDASSVRHRLDAHVECLIDDTGRLAFDDVRRPQAQSLFGVHQNHLMFGYLTSPIWLKIKCRSMSPERQWYLKIPAPFLEYVDFYQLREDGTWHHTTSGYYRKQSERLFSHTAHVLPLEFKGDSDVATVYVRIGGVSPKTFPVFAVEKNAFIEETRLEDLAYGVFFGILAVMFLYNLLIYLNLRQKSYFLYLCIIALTFLVFASISGYGGKFLWPENPLWNYIGGKLSLEILILCLTLYTVHVLRVKQYSKTMYVMLLALIPLSAIALALVVSGVFAYAGNTLIVLSLPVFIAAGIAVRLKGNRNADHYITAWSFYFVGGLMLTLRNSGMMAYNFWSTHFAELGAVMGTTVIGFALGIQYRRFKKEKDEAQQLALTIQQEATARMEAKVHERTGQLNEANAELTRTLEKNRQQTEIIKSKNAELDAFFYRISHDLKGPISSSLGLMILAKLDVKDPVALEYIDKQHQQMERLSQIVHGLANLTQLNNAQLVKERIDFERMIDGCIASFNTFANFSRLKFQKDVRPALDFQSEWTLVNTILQNLIENAIKYAGEQDPYVKITVHDEPGWLVITVEDNGLGIAEEHHTRIYDMFYRATAESIGSGLGLYILKRSVDRLQGTVELTSAQGVGSKFTVRLPFNNVLAISR